MATAMNAQSSSSSELDDSLAALQQNLDAAVAEDANNVLVSVDALQSVVKAVPLLRRQTHSLQRQINAFEFERGEDMSFGL
jgi:vacuolar-type H+-ATPase subunit D/Vma8